MIDIFMANDILEEDKVTHNEYSLGDKFREFNEKYFNNILKEVPMFWDRATKHTGVLNFKIRGTNNEIFDQTITLTKVFKRDELHFDKVLLHEMIHLWNTMTYPDYTEYRRQCGKDGHGHLFQERVAIISKRCGFEIPLRDDISEAEPSSTKTREVDFMLVNTKTTPRISIFTKGTITDHIDEMLEGSKFFLGKFDDVYVGKSNAWQLSTHFKVNRKFFGSRSITFSTITSIKDNIFPELVEMGKRIK